MILRKDLSFSQIKSEMILPQSGISLPAREGQLFPYVPPRLFKEADILQSPNFKPKIKCLYRHI